MSTDEDDQVLCARARDGCEESFETLFRRHHSSLHAFVYRLCLDAACAEDIVQESFIKAARSLQDFRGESSFRNWLYRIAVNSTRSWQRSDIRLRQATEDLTRQQETIEHEQDFSPVHEALASLAEDLRHAVALVYYEDLSHGEAARILGCAEATVSWRIFRAKRRLKHLLSRGGTPR
jgi:RNA polymerase sigma-70 factor, ECF subfamily